MHFLGQSFVKAFSTTFADADSVEGKVWDTSWGVSTQMLGALVVAYLHKVELVLPLHVTLHQVVLVPVVMTKAKEVGHARIVDAARAGP